MPAPRTKTSALRVPPGEPDVDMPASSGLRGDLRAALFTCTLHTHDHVDREASFVLGPAGRERGER